jgi:CheY-like chemotaxis protein
VKGIVELHGGAVKADSAGLGHGTEITFWLPLGQKPRAPVRAPVPVLSTRPLRILIIEDNVDAARTLAKLLMRYGHEVTTAYQGPAGLESARTLRPEVVLCDLGLPEMDGYEIARALRSDPATQSIRLIAVSGYGQEDDRRHSEEAGFDLHLTKPVDPTELQRLLAVLKVGA